LKKIYVGNLAYQTTEEGLESAFSAFGTVSNVAIIRDRETGQSRGFGFVEMDDDSQAEAAIAGLNGTQVDGRTRRRPGWSRIPRRRTRRRASRALVVSAAL